MKNDAIIDPIDYVAVIDYLLKRVDATSLRLQIYKDIDFGINVLVHITDKIFSSSWPLANMHNTIRLPSIIKYFYPNISRLNIDRLNIDYIDWPPRNSIDKMILDINNINIQQLSKDICIDMFKVCNSTNDPIRIRKDMGLHPLLFSSQIFLNNGETLETLLVEMDLAMHKVES